jgi:excisionase family DNA binding protein
MENLAVTPTGLVRAAWSIGDIAEATGLSQGFLRAEVRRGKLRIRKFGRRVLVLRDDLDLYLKTGSEPEVVSD